MIGRIHNKERKRREFAREHAAKIKPFDITLVDKKLRHLWNTDETIGDTLMIKCTCGHKRRFHFARGLSVCFVCTKCETRQLVRW